MSILLCSCNYLISCSLNVIYLLNSFSDAYYVFSFLVLLYNTSYSFLAISSSFSTLTKVMSKIMAFFSLDWSGYRFYRSCLLMKRDSCLEIFLSSSRILKFSCLNGPSSSTVIMSRLRLLDLWRALLQSHPYLGLEGELYYGISYLCSSRSCPTDPL